MWVLRHTQVFVRLASQACTKIALCLTEIRRKPDPLRGRGGEDVALSEAAGQQSIPAWGAAERMPLNHGGQSSAYAGMGSCKRDHRLS